MTEPWLKDSVVRVVGFLVSREYSRLERLTRGRRLTEDEIRRAIEEYPATLRMPPADAFAELDVIQIEDAVPSAYNVRFDLWTIEEGRSDLNLEMIIGERDGEPDVEITDIRVP